MNDTNVILTDTVVSVLTKSSTASQVESPKFFIKRVSYTPTPIPENTNVTTTPYVTNQDSSLVSLSKYKEIKIKSENIYYSFISTKGFGREDMSIEDPSK